MSSPVIELINVSKVYSLRRYEGASLSRMLARALRGRPRSGYHYALADLSLRVEPGQSVAVFGINGCGKTTLLKLISGITPASGGTIHVRGRVGGVVELSAGFHNDLNGIENVFLQGTILGLSRAEVRRRLDSILDFAELGHFIHTPVRHYSWGMMLRLAFAVAVHADPDIVLIDEALAVGDGYFQWKCLRRIREMKEQGRTLLFVTHVPDLAEAMCDQAIWIADGRVREQGTTHEVAINYSRALFGDALGASPMEWRNEMYALMPHGRYGSGEVLIRSVEISSSDGVPNRRVYRSGETLRIQVEVEARRELRNIGLAFWFERADQLIGITMSHLVGITYDLRVGVSKLSGVLPEIPLHAGTYYLSVSVYDADPLKLHDSHMKMQTFTITDEAEWYSSRVLKMPARIEMEVETQQ